MRKKRNRKETMEESNAELPVALPPTVDLQQERPKAKKATRSKRRTAEEKMQIEVTELPEADKAKYLAGKVTKKTTPTPNKKYRCPRDGCNHSAESKQGIERHYYAHDHVFQCNAPEC